MKALRVLGDVTACAARAVRRAFVPCLLVFVGTCAVSTGIGYLISSGGWITGLRVGLVLAGFFTLAVFLLINPLIRVDETAVASLRLRTMDRARMFGDWWGWCDSNGLNPATGRPMFDSMDSASSSYSRSDSGSFRERSSFDSLSSSVSSSDFGAGVGETAPFCPHALTGNPASDAMYYANLNRD